MAGIGLFGPTLAGITIAVIGVDGAFYLNAFSFLASSPPYTPCVASRNRSDASSRRMQVGADWWPACSRARAR